MAEPSVNETISDALVRRNVYLMRFAVDAAGRMIGNIDATTDQLSGFLRRQKKLAKLLQTEPNSRKTRTALNEFTKEVLAIREQGFDKAFDENYSQMYDLAQSEIDYTSRAITRTLDKKLGEDVSLYVVPKQAVNNLLAFGDYGGNDIKTWYKKMKDDDVNRIVGTARAQMAQGKTLEQMEKAVIGTPEFGYHDGVVDRTRRSAETFCRTISVGVANAAREETYKANDDVISQEQFQATLDGRTSLQCAALDGKKYPIGQAPQPPLHPNCRSVLVPVIDGLEEFLVDRISVPGHNFRQEARKEYIDKWMDKGLTEKEARARWNDLSNGRINTLINEQKKKFSDEAAAPVPANTTYDEWLRRQPEGFQNEVLGKTRAEAFRNGATLDQFVDANSNQPLTISEMKEKEPEIFEDKTPAKEDEEPLDRNEKADIAVREKSAEQADEVIDEAKEEAEDNALFLSGGSTDEDNELSAEAKGQSQEIRFSTHEKASEYLAKEYGIKAVYDNWTIEAANRMNDAIDKISREFKINVSKITDANDLVPGYYGVYEPKTKLVGIKQIAETELVDIANAQFNNRIWSTNSINHPIYHELGHSIFSGYSQLSEKYQNINTLFSRYKFQLEGPNAYENFLSWCANESINEFAAETFARYMAHQDMQKVENDDEKTSLSPIMLAVIKILKEQ